MRHLIVNYAHSLAIAANMFSTTGLLITLSFLGRPEVAADVGIVQGSILLVFMAFSGNARNLILSSEIPGTRKKIFTFRILLMVPLAYVSFLLSSSVIDVAAFIVITLIARRMAEWIAELQICDCEQMVDASFAIRFFIIQSVCFLLLIAGVESGEEGAFYQSSLLIWSLSPLYQIVPYILRMMRQKHEGSLLAIKSFIPHVGSSWIIAISTYVFRVLIVLLAGRHIAGLLFSAYAIGGLLNSVYTYALGPTLAQKTDERVTTAGERRGTFYVVSTLVVSGLCLAISAYAGLLPLADSYFLQTIGFSLMGGGIMLLAQRKRIEIIQTYHGTVFVQDLFANVVIILMLPFAYHAFGLQSFTGYFLWSSLLTYAIYTFPSLQERISTSKSTLFLFEHPFQSLIIFFLSFPLFFQLNSYTIFNAQEMAFDSQGKLLLLPLPVSIVACFAGILFLIRIDRVKESAMLIFVLFMSMLLSTFVTFNSRFEELTKLTLLVQFLLPFFALILGQSYRRPDSQWLRFEAIFLYVLMLIVPFELLATYLQDEAYLTPYLYAFSLYQHLHYLPVVFVGMYLLGVASLFEDQRFRLIVLLLAPCMGAYAIASMSLLAIWMLASGMLSIAFVFIVIKRDYWRYMVALVLLTLAPMAANGNLTDGEVLDPMAAQSEQLHPVRLSQGALPVSFEMRVEQWGPYWEGITESPKTFLFGQSQRPDRRSSPSAYNYYLDLMYSFGVVGAISMFWLVGYILYNFFFYVKLGRKLGSEIRGETIALGVLVLFMLLIDSLFNVTLRQPYPGMISFFLCGVLLNRLNERVASSHANSI